MAPRAAAAAALLLALARAAAARAALADYTRLARTDLSPCISPCVRVGACGAQPPNPDGACNVTWLAQQCDATYGCVAFNTDGWLKGCGAPECGAAAAPSSIVDTYVKDGGAPPAPTPVPAVEDEHYPPEEPAEAASGGLAPAVSHASVAGQWALLADRNAPAGGAPPANVSAGGAAFGFVLLAVVALDDGSPAAVVERSFARWGFLAFVRDEAAGGGEVARLRKGTGAVAGLAMPSFAHLDDGYYARVAAQPDDWLGQRVLNDTAGEPSFLAAAKYLPPQRDYASIGAVAPYQKWSVSPDGRIKAADSAIYTPAAAANETGPGRLVHDPRWYLPAVPPSQPNFTFVKSALVGGHLRVVATVAYEPSTTAGFEQLAFAPASEPAASAYVRVRGTLGPEAPPFAYVYVNASLNSSRPIPLAPAAFYGALLAEQRLWNATLVNAGASFTLPGREGARQVDTALGALVASLSLFIGPQPNYGDGEGVCVCVCGAYLGSGRHVRECAQPTPRDP